MSEKVYRTDELITLAEYAKLKGKEVSTVRQKILRGNLEAVKMGRNWMIAKDTPYDDRRKKDNTQNGVDIVENIFWDKKAQKWKIKDWRGIHGNFDTRKEAEAYSGSPTEKARADGKSLLKQCVKPLEDTKEL